MLCFCTASATLVALKYPDFSPHSVGAAYPLFYRAWLFSRCVGGSDIYVPEKQCVLTHTDGGSFQCNGKLSIAYKLGTQAADIISSLGGNAVTLPICLNKSFLK